MVDKICKTETNEWMTACIKTQHPNKVPADWRQLTKYIYINTLIYKPKPKTMNCLNEFL